MQNGHSCRIVMLINTTLLLHRAESTNQLFDWACTHNQMLHYWLLASGAIQPWTSKKKNGNGKITEEVAEHGFDWASQGKSRESAHQGCVG